MKAWARHCQTTDSSRNTFQKLDLERDIIMKKLN